MMCRESTELDELKQASEEASREANQLEELAQLNYELCTSWLDDAIRESHKCQKKLKKALKVRRGKHETQTKAV